MMNKRFVMAAAIQLSCCAAWCQTLFSANERGAVGETIASHIEKTVAQLAAMPDEEKAGQLAAKKGVGIVVEGLQGVGARAAAKHLTTRCHQEHRFFKAKGDKKMSCRWEFEDGNSIIVLTEISRENIEGTDKAQADSLLLQTIKRIPAATYKRPVPSEKQLSSVERTSVYELKGRTLLHTVLNSHTYYIKDKGAIKAVFSKKFPVETIHNLVLGALPSNNYQLDITEDVYTAHSETMRVKLQDFVAYWLQDGRFNLYCGAEPKKGTKDYEVVLVMEHKELQYIHMLRFTLNEALLDKPSVIKARLTPNIPQHNIDTMF